MGKSIAQRRGRRLEEPIFMVASRSGGAARYRGKRKGEVCTYSREIRYYQCQRPRKNVVLLGDPEGDICQKIPVLRKGNFSKIL